MDIYAGIDVSLNASSVCVVDGSGKVLKEAKVGSAPEALIGFFEKLPARPTRIGLEAGPLSQWLYASLREKGFGAILMETRQVKDAFKSRPVKTDRKDARGIAELVRLGWYREVHCKSREAQETRALLTARACLRAKRHDVEMSLRGILRGFGLKVGKTAPKSYPARVLELARGSEALMTVATRCWRRARRSTRRSPTLIGGRWSWRRRTRGRVV
jgi:transposase